MQQLCSLPENLLVSVLSATGGLSSRDLARLESVARHFRQRTAALPHGEGASVADCAAEEIVRARGDGWRVNGNGWPVEGRKYALFLLEFRLCLLPTVAACNLHSMVCRSGGLYVAGDNEDRKLGLQPIPGQPEPGQPENPRPSFQVKFQKVVLPLEPELGGGGSGNFDSGWSGEEQVVSVSAGDRHSACITEPSTHSHKGEP